LPQKIEASMNHLAEKPTRCLLFVPLLLMAVAQGAAAQGRWQKFSAPDGDFAVEFPAVPQHSSVPGNWEGGPVEVYSATVDKHSYRVAYQDAPQPVDAMSRASVKALADSCRLSARSTSRKLLRVRQLSGGIVECLSTGPSGNDSYPTDLRLERNFVRGPRYYILAIISWEPGGVDGASAGHFFSSFRLSPAQVMTSAVVPHSQQSLPLTPQYEYDSVTGITRVILPSSPVEGASGASFVGFSAKYAYDSEWRYAGTMNEVLLFFGMVARGQVCPGECQLTLTVDGERASFEVEAQGEPDDGSGTRSQAVSFWLKPQAFRRLANARSISAQVGGVSFRLTERQMEGMRQMLPFLKERFFP
jgi:hypothetical protein